MVAAHSMVAGMVALGAWIANAIAPGPVGAGTGAGAGSGPAAPVVTESGSPLRIDCPDLDTESRAAFEARARAELTLSPQPVGEIAVACELNAAHVGWHAANGWRGQRDVGLNSDAATVVDSLLGAVHALRAGSVTSPPPLVTGLALQRTDPEAALVAAPRARRDGPGLRVGLEAALYGEVWEGSVAGGLEGQVGVRIDTRSRWELALIAGYGRGLEPAEGIHARTLMAMLGVAHLPVPNLEIEAGGLWRSLTATNDVGDLREASVLGVYGAIRYVLARGRLAMAVGPHLSLLGGPMVVSVDNTEVFRVPRFVTGLSLGGRVDLNR